MKTGQESFPENVIEKVKLGWTFQGGIIHQLEKEKQGKEIYLKAEESQFTQAQGHKKADSQYWGRSLSYVNVVSENDDISI